MIKISSTLNYSTGGVKILIYGPAGIGKTPLCATAPRPFIISAEAGLLSLANLDVPVVEIETKEQLDEAYQFVTESEEAKNFATICLDSVTEIAEKLLITFKGEEKDARQAYGRANDDVAMLIRSFRDIKGKNVYFTAKQQRVPDEDLGITRYMPGMPGKTLLNGMPYFFDEVFAMKVGRLDDGTQYKYLQTYNDINYLCKDRSCRLLPQEKTDLSYIFKKIAGADQVKEVKNGKTAVHSK